MKLDISSLYFNGETLTSGNTASWGTALGQQKPDYPITAEGAQELVDLIKINSIDFNPIENKNHTANITNISKKKIFAAGKFDTVYLNNKSFNIPFILLIIEETYGSHIGRKSLKYNNKIKVDNISNEDFYKSVQKYFGQNSCWFIYDISVMNNQLHLSAIKVDDNPQFYSDSKERKDHWESLINDFSDIKETFKNYLLDIHKLKNKSTAIEYVNSMPKIEKWFKENDLCSSDYQIFNVKNDNSKINKALDTNFKNKWSTLNQEEKGWYGTPWNRWLEFINWYYENVTPSKNKEKMFKYKEFIESCNLAGLKYSTPLITRYISSLATKPFVLLSGLSGSGKTKLAEAFAKWICASETQYALIPVGADWTNREPLLGYPNALKDNEYIKPDNDALELILRAQKDKKKPYFLILDEMNLSHVERYFADFLSTMESDSDIPLHKLNDEVNGIPNTLRIPPNLFIVGTVNIDETTYMFSPKVLDRANTIEFRVEENELGAFLENPKGIDFNHLIGKGVEMAASFIKICESEKEDYKLSSDIQKEIKTFFSELQKAGAEFGYRSAYEMSKLIFKLNQFGMKNDDEKLDVAIMQKMLPKLHGSRTKLSRVLNPLAKACLNKVDDKFEENYFNNFESIDFKNDETIKYKISFEKIMRMYKNAIENGFASYAEA